MRRLAALLVISTTLWGISGCAGRPAPLTVQHAFTRCPRPARPDVPVLDPDRHLCAPENLEKLLELVDRQCWMIDQQAAALDCYEAQAGRGAQ